MGAIVNALKVTLLIKRHIIQTTEIKFILFLWQTYCLILPYSCEKILSGVKSRLQCKYDKPYFFEDLLLRFSKIKMV